MQVLNCQKHQMKKDFVFCLDLDCDDRLACIECYVFDKKHDRHRIFMSKSFMDGEEDEIKRVFNHEYLQSIRENMDSEQFMQQFDNEFKKCIDEKEEELRTSFEKIISNYRASLEEAKQKIYDRLKVKEVKSIEEIIQNVKDLIENDNSQDKQKTIKEQIDCCNQIDKIKKTLDQMMEQLEFNNQNYLEYRNKIKQMEDQKEQYCICLNFYHSDTSLEFKQQVMNMIDELGVNHKVGIVEFILNDSNKYNADLIMKINSNYRNLWGIYIRDGYDQVDNNMHDQLTMMVINLTVLEFQLYFDNPLFSNDQGLKLLKEYNEIIRIKTHLEYLYYYHSKMNKNSSDKQEIRQMIETISNV